MRTDRAGGLNALLERCAKTRILVIGDLMLDEYIWGMVSRISPEAPVPVVNVIGESYYPGGAANVARNVGELTGRASLIGACGKDVSGKRLIELLEASGIVTDGIQQDTGFSTTTKSRIVARNQQVVRVDRERKTPLTRQQTERAIAYLDSVIASFDAVIVADYGKGFLTQPMADVICKTARTHRKVLTVDPHPHTSLFWRGATAIKPNRMEAFLAADIPPADPVTPVLADEPLLEAGKRLMERWEAESLLITLGEQGMLLFSGGAAPHHIPTSAKEVFDVSGAGDTAIAVLTAGLAAGGTPLEAAELANRASGIAVGKLGTATVTIAELRKPQGA